jgi:hypothetical protein
MDSLDIQAKIVGVASLVQHRYQFTDEKERQATRKTGSKDHTQEWRDFLYIDEAGMIYEPALHIEGALIKAAGSFQISGRGKRTYRDLFKSAVFVLPEAIPLGKKEPDRIHRARMVVARSSVERYRPEFVAGWQLQFSIRVMDSQISKDVVRQVLEHAGAFCGIGDSRPRFGRFRITEFE